jgi:hypothetical protein
VGQAVAVEAVGVHAKQLHLALQAAEGRGIQHARIIAHAFLAAFAAAVGLGVHPVLERQYQRLLGAGEFDSLLVVHCHPRVCRRF